MVPGYGQPILIVLYLRGSVTKRWNDDVRGDRDGDLSLLSLDAQMNYGA